ncbi:YkvA family protein [Aerococcus urinaeequi]|uniref:DUF1232 domain-containing protein n=1 Tax=Aerococcus viridans TaxID=1377 RepID=A0A2N6UGH5_9LACT|nr:MULTISPECIES: DUF1232 domain-containing protein [Aerococcus]PMC80606.1 DUF1232 domain-containing protein [Aerococcus viridans]
MKQTSKMTLGKFAKALFNKETPTYIKAITGLALAYTIFPADILPDIFGPLGFVDDAAVIGILTTIAMSLLDNYNEKKATETVNTYTDFDPDKVIN